MATPISRVSPDNDTNKVPEEIDALEPRDYAKAAEYIWDEHARRKADRAELEAVWDDIDRQVAMKYDEPPIDRASGRAKRGTAWLPKLELPWQAETREILTTDLDRMVFPATGNHFEIEADANEKVLQAVEEGIRSTEGELAGEATQDLLNEMVTALHERYQRVYGYRGQWRDMFGHAFQYGTMIGRQRPALISSVAWDGETFEEDMIAPVLSAMSPRNVYLDTSPYSAQRQGWVIAPAQIYSYTQRLADLRLAAKRFSNDPSELNGGWLPRQLETLEARNERGEVDVLELEGDIVIERSEGDPIYLPNVIITTIQGNSTTRTMHGSDRRVIRVRVLPTPFRSYLYQPYFRDRDDACGVYGTSPLMKGRPIQKAASVTLNRWIAVAILNAEPPIKFDPQDPHFAAAGGPTIEPRALWPTLSEAEPVQIGDLVGLGGTLAQLRSEYSDVTGTSAPRLGQQTKSHQTAFAVDSELIRGLSRTVSFGQWVTSELMPRALQQEYWLLRRYLPKSGVRVMLPKTKAWVTVTRQMLPELVRYTVAGAADPLIEREKQQQRLVALQQIAATDQAAQAAGNPPINWRALQREILTEAGFNDVDRILESIPPMDLALGGLGGVPGGPAIGPAASPAAGGVPTAVPLRLAAGQAGPPAG